MNEASRCGPSSAPTTSACYGSAAQATAEAAKQSTCCGTPKARDTHSYGPAQYLVGEVQTPAGSVPRLSTQLTRADRLGAWRMRWGFGRDDYRVRPALYAIGDPDATSPVLVTANYKLTLDALRGSLGGTDAWVLVVDTHGINVWCYIEDVVSLELDESLCNGCGLCIDVCPRGAFAMNGKRVALVDRGACLECGACALNCVTGAITVDPGVGCAQAIIKGWLTGSEPSCGCG